MAAIGRATSTISIEVWNKVHLIIGLATKVELNKAANIPAYLLSLNFGQSLMDEHFTLWKKPCYTSSAQLCSNHSIEQLTFQRLMCVANFPRKQIGKMKSDCLVTGAQQELLDYDARRETTVFMRPSREVALGSRISIFGQPEVVEKNPRNLSWPEFTALDLRVATITACKLRGSDGAQSTFIESPDHKGDDDNKIGSKELSLVEMTCDLGDDLGHAVPGVGFIQEEEMSPKDLLDKQVLVLANLDSVELASCFRGVEATAVLCTVAGKAFIEPAQIVQNGYKIA